MGAYTNLDYGKMSLSLPFLAMSGGLVVIYVAIFLIDPGFITEQEDRISTMVIFLYGFFAFSFLGYIQTKFAQFKVLFAELMAEMESYHELLLATKDQPAIESGARALKLLLNGLRDRLPNEFELPKDFGPELFKPLSLIDDSKPFAVNHHFSLLLRCTSILSLAERIDVKRARYLTGELSRVFLSFTGLFLMVLGTIGLYSVVSVITSILLSVIIVFSVLYIYHLDAFNYSESELVQNRVRRMAALLDLDLAQQQGAPSD